MITVSRLLPSLTSPPSGDNVPVSRRSRVVLPAPFGPTSPKRLPRSRRNDRSRTTGLSAKDFETASATIANFPDVAASTAVSSFRDVLPRRVCRN